MSLERPPATAYLSPKKTRDGPNSALELFSTPDNASPHTKNLRHAIRVRKMRDQHSDFYHVLDDLSRKVKAYTDLFYVKQPKNRWEPTQSPRARKAPRNKETLSLYVKCRSAFDAVTEVKPKPSALKKMNTVRPSPFMLGNVLTKGSVLTPHMA